MDCTIGKNNSIAENVKIGKNVVIGDNNTIKEGTVIYDNTKIGNSNIILEGNILGSLPVEANIDYKNICHGGLQIGNNNFFHIKNIISSGCYQKTIIGNNNKFLSEVYISHDNIVGDSATFYPRVFSSGLVQYDDFSGVGAGAHIHQKLRVGSYSMIGMNNTITKNVIPFIVCINGRYSRINLKKAPSIVSSYGTTLSEICDKYYNGTLNMDDYKNILDKETYETLYRFITNSK